MKSKLILCSIFVAILMMAHCVGEEDLTPNVDCSKSPATFSTVNTIIRSSCTEPSCHPYASSNGPGQLMTHSDIFAARASIAIAVESGSMPKDRRLTAAEKNAILCWIENGAPNN